MYELPLRERREELAPLDRLPVVVDEVAEARPFRPLVERGRCERLDVLGVLEQGQRPRRHSDVPVIVLQVPAHRVVVLVPRRKLERLGRDEDLRGAPPDVAPPVRSVDEQSRSIVGLHLPAACERLAEEVVERIEVAPEVGKCEPERGHCARLEVADRVPFSWVDGGLAEPV